MKWIRTPNSRLISMDFVLRVGKEDLSVHWNKRYSIIFEMINENEEMYFSTEAERDGSFDEIILFLDSPKTGVYEL